MVIYTTFQLVENRNLKDPINFEKVQYFNKLNMKLKLFRNSEIFYLLLEI